MAIQHEIGARLRRFGERKFRSMAEFAKALGIRQSNLNKYLNGSRIPGNKMEARLEQLGCDRIWLISGMHRELLDHRFDNLIERRARSMMPEDFAMLDYLRSVGIDTKVELEAMLNDKTIPIIKAVAASDPSFKSKKNK